METLTKRIVAIALIAVIGTGIGIGAWYFLVQEEVGEGENTWTYPGLTTTPSLSRTIAVGLLEDMTYAYGPLTYAGMYLAAMEINLGGGVDFDGTPYYIGVGYEDTLEAASALVGVQPGITAALKMIERNPDVIIGGFRSDVVDAYGPHIMAAGIPFIGTGASLQEFCWEYDWPTFFRVMPQNSWWLGNHTAYMITKSIIPNMVARGINVNQTTILYEEFVWTTDVKNLIVNALLAESAATPGVDLGLANITTQAVTEAWTPLQFDAYWDVIDARGDQLVIPILSSLSIGDSFGKGYNETQPNAIVAGINVAHTLTGYLSDYGGAQYEISFAGSMRINSTPLYIPFWDAYHNLTETMYSVPGGLDPVYTAQGAYDAIRIIANATDDANSLAPADIVASLEKIDEDHPFQGISYLIAFDQYHDLVGTIPGERDGFAFPVFLQYNQTGEKNIIPSSFPPNPTGYPNWMVTSALLYPHWWSVPPLP